MRLPLSVFILIVLATLTRAIPRAKRDAYLNQNYLVQTSQILATNLLKDNIDIDGNHVHSPLGISTVLAILAEGSRGDTYKEFVSSLGFPEDKAALRNSAKEILLNFNSKDVATTPAFKTWFYIYRNNTIKDDYKQIVRDYYLADVKDIDRSNYDWDGPSTMNHAQKDNSKDIIGFETLKKSESFDDLHRQKSYDDVVDAIEAKKEASKFDKVVDDKQYVEVPVIKEEIAKEQQLEQAEQKPEDTETAKDPEDKHNGDDAQHLIDVKEGEVNDEDNETIKDEEKKEELKKDSVPLAKPLESSEPERISIPLKKLDELEIMQTVESEFSSARLYRGRKLLLMEDVTSALSANSIVGSENGQTKILLFNGLYFRGNWLYPFQELRDGPEDLFYVSKDESMQMTMMRTFGEFRTTQLADLDSEAIEFPYEDKRHSLLVLLPREREGLRNLIENLQTADIPKIRKQLTSERLLIRMPKFSIDSTSRSEATLKTLGVRRLFSTDECDLRDISEDEPLHVDEIVQHVNIRVDQGSCKEDAVTAGAETRSVDDESRSVALDRPFLYYIINNENNFVLVVGKITSPDTTDEHAF